MPSAWAFCVISLAKPSSSPPRFSATVTAASLADLVTMPLMASSTADGLAGLEIELGRILFGGVFGNLQLRVEPDLAGVEALEQEIKRHHLGQRRGMAQGVGVRGFEYGAAIAVDHDRRARRIVGALFRMGMMPRVTVMHVVDGGAVMVPGIGRVAGDGECRCRRDQTQQAAASPREPSAGLPNHQAIMYPVPEAPGPGGLPLFAFGVLSFAGVRNHCRRKRLARSALPGQHGQVR